MFDSASRPNPAMRFLTGVSLLAAAALVSEAPGTQLFAQTQAAPRVTETVFKLAGGEEMLYAISLPAGYDGDSDDRRPLILALHPGGRASYYRKRLHAADRRTGAARLGGGDRGARRSNTELGE